jgi:hypothetical protein
MEMIILSYPLCVSIGRKRYGYGGALHVEYADFEVQQADSIGIQVRAIERSVSKSYAEKKPKTENWSEQSERLGAARLIPWGEICEVVRLPDGWRFERNTQD